MCTHRYLCLYTQAAFKVLCHLDNYQSYSLLQTNLPYTLVACGWDDGGGAGSDDYDNTNNKNENNNNNNNNNENNNNDNNNADNNNADNAGLTIAVANIHGCLLLLTLTGS